MYCSAYCTSFIPPVCVTFLGEIIITPLFQCNGSLYNNAFGEEGATALADGLAENRGLHEITMGHSVKSLKVGEDGSRAIVKALHDNAGSALVE